MSREPIVKEYTEREQWAEIEAKMFDKLAKAQRENAKGWLDKGMYSNYLSIASDCLVRAEAYEEAARILRQPYCIRIETKQTCQHNWVYSHTCYHKNEDYDKCTICGETC